MKLYKFDCGCIGLDSKTILLDCLERVCFEIYDTPNTIKAYINDDYKFRELQTALKDITK